MDRREVLKFGLSAFPLLGGCHLWAKDLPKVKAKKDTNIIFIWLPGGLHHMDMYDMKPNAPIEYRGIYSPIRTNVKGIEVSELMPMHAKIADKFAIIRSMDHESTLATQFLQQEGVVIHPRGIAHAQQLTLDATRMT